MENKKFNLQEDTQPTEEAMKRYLNDLVEIFDEYVSSINEVLGGNNNLTNSYRNKKYSEIVNLVNRARNWRDDSKLLVGNELNSYKNKEYNFNHQRQRMFYSSESTIRTKVREARRADGCTSRRGNTYQVKALKSDLRSFTVRSFCSLDNINHHVREALHTICFKESADIVSLYITEQYRGWKIDVWRTDDKEILSTWDVNKSFAAL